MHQLDDAIVRKMRVFSSLENEGAETEFMAACAAGQNVLRRQAVAGGAGVGAPDAAVQAVVAAEIGELDEAAHINAPAERGKRRLPRGGEKLRAERFTFGTAGGTGVDDADKGGAIRHAVTLQCADDAGKKCEIGGLGHTAHKGFKKSF